MTFTLKEIYTILAAMIPIILAAVRYYYKFKKSIEDRDIKIAEDQKLIDNKQNLYMKELKEEYETKIDNIKREHQSKEKEVTLKIIDLEHRLTNFSERLIQHNERFIRVDLQVDDIAKDLSKLDINVGVRLDKFAEKLDKIYEILADKL